MNNKGIISLLGCGWLGFPLAKTLVSNGFLVRASTTTNSKLEILKKASIDPYLVHFPEAVHIPDFKKLLEAETLIMTIPPGRKNPDGFENYRRTIQYLVDELPGSKISKVILISSTSVYADTNSTVNEFSETSPITESGKLMVEAEQILTEGKADLVTLRLAGLIGPERMPGKFFAGKTHVDNGLAPINLIHRDDVIGIICALVRNQDTSGIYNACAPTHPSRQEFYTLAAQIEGLEPPQFISGKTDWKIISSSRLAAELNYTFEVPSLMGWLNSIKQQ